MINIHQWNIGFIFIAYVHLFVFFRPSEFAFINTYYPVYIVALLSLFYNYRHILSILIKREVLILVCIVILYFSISILNSSNDGFYDKRLLLTWVAWILIVISLMTLIKRPNKILSLMEKMAKAIIVVQVLFSSVQLFYPDFFSQIWTSVETRGLDSYVRVTGSMVNPIPFSFFVSYLVLIIIAREGPERNLLWVFIAGALVILSGTRSLILVYPFLIAGWYYLDNNSSLFKRLFNAFICALFLYVLIFIALYFFRGYLTYSAELLSLFGINNYSVNDLHQHEELRTYGYRVLSWNTALMDFFSRDLFSMVFGNPGPYTSSAHHDLLYMLTRFGILGLVIYLFLNLYLLELAYKNRDKSEGRLMYLSVLMILVVGMANTVGVEMKMGILSAITTGLFLSSDVHKRKDSRKFVFGWPFIIKPA